MEIIMHMYGAIRLLVVLLGGFLVVGLLPAESALACGGFFCQNSPVDQNAERIIFTQNGDGTVSAYIQIQYTGFAPDFSWILPLPSAIEADDLEVPESAMNAFLELEAATNPVFIPPPMPECAERMLMDMAIPEAAAEGTVEVFATGEVGPYGFDVVGSEDKEAMIHWLRDHAYQVTEQMEPLIDLYVREGFVFLAMRLLPDQGVQDIQPIKVTYHSSRPMIPLRLTAVAANPDMRVLVWVYAEQQAVPANYGHFSIDDRELTLTPFGGTNYRQVLSERADEFGGQAFITEYAMSSDQLPVVDPLLQELRGSYPYLTRLSTVISPEEMTVDPEFDYDRDRPDVSNIHDLSGLEGLYECERDAGSIFLPFFGGAASGDPQAEEGSGVRVPVGIVAAVLLVCAAALFILLLGVMGAIFLARRRP